MSDAQQWLEWLFGEKPPGLIWVGGHGDGFKGRTFVDAGSAAEYARWLDDGAAGGVYFRLSLLKPRADDAAGRGLAADSSHIVAFGADLDIEGPGHKMAKSPRPGSEDELRSILAGAGAPEPTAWVHSGGGRYAFWKLAEPLDLTSDPLGGLTTAAGVSSELHAAIIAEAAGRGFKIDNTRDLARVYRLPGTHNRKGSLPFIARALYTVGPRVTLAGLRGGLKMPSSTASDILSDSKVSDGVSDRPASVLFRDDAGVELETRLAQPVRDFTVAEAKAYCDPFVMALMNAADGEINVRLNDAAVAMAHFGREFWTREQAETVLNTALSATVYDGATWKADDTIRSAYAAAEAGQGDAEGDAGGGAWWRAVLVRDARPSAVEVDYAAVAAGVGDDDVDALLAEMLGPEELIAQRPPRHLVRGLLTFDSESWLIGEPGSKKSFVALDIAAHVALGMPWQGRKVTQAPVVLIVAEGAGGIGKRVDAWTRTYGQGLTKDVFRVLPRPVQAKDPVAWAVLVKACERIGAGMVVIDTQARVTVGLEENSATDMGMYVNAARAIRQATRACVLTVHHTGRRGGDARGSSAIDGAQDTELKIKPVRKSYALLTTEKQKDIEPADPIKIKFSAVGLGLDDEGEAVTSLTLVPSSAWNVGEMDDESFEQLDREATAMVTPFAGREAPEAWTYRRTDPKAALQRWALQALADTAEDRGLTQSEWRGVVEEKIGKQTGTSWRRAFQVVTGLKFDGLVIKVQGADRWVVDRLTVAAEGE